MKQFLGKIKVPAGIRPITGSERIAPELEVGKGYYVCYGNNNVYRCRLSEIINEFAKTEVRILLPLKHSHRKFIGQDGKWQYSEHEEMIVYADEIGSTPEEAVRHTVR